MVALVTHQRCRPAGGLSGSGGLSGEGHLVGVVKPQRVCSVVLYIVGGHL